MYAESAYAKYGQNGTAVLPPEARIAGNLQKYTNDVIRNALIAKLEVPNNLVQVGFTKDNYITLLQTGKVEVTQNGIKKTYITQPSELYFARSAVTSKRTCFNAVFAITIPTDIKANWTDTSVTTTFAGSGGLEIGTDTIMSGVTRSSELSAVVTGKNYKKEPEKDPPS